MRLAGLTLMISALALLLAMVVNVIPPGLAVSLLSYGLLFAGVFCFTAGVIRRQ